MSPYPTNPPPAPPRLTVCPLCRGRVGLRPDGATIKRHTFAARIPGGVVCGLSCDGGGLTVAEAQGRLADDPAGAVEGGPAVPTLFDPNAP